MYAATIGNVLKTVEIKSFSVKLLILKIHTFNQFPLQTSHFTIESDSKVFFRVWVSQKKNHHRLTNKGFKKIYLNLLNKFSI